MGVIPMFHPTPRVSTSVPFTYRDGITTLELIECLRKNLEIVRSQANDIAQQLADYETQNNAEHETLQSEIDKINGLIEDIQAKIGEIIPTADAWNVTEGRYTDSRKAMRDTYRELAVFGARVNQIATITVDELAKHRTDEVAAVGNLTIFNDATPRVTDPETGDPYATA